MAKQLKRITATICTALMLQFTAACAPVHRLPTPIARIPVPPENYAPGPALWKVADDDTTVYLFGTVHALPKDIEWYFPHIATALESSNELVTEVDISDSAMMPALIAAKAMLPEGENLREIMPQADRAPFEATMISLGLPVSAFDHYEPWYAAMAMALIPLLNSGYDTNIGVENMLGQKVGPATARDALETAEFQLNLFDTMPIDEQYSYLRQIIDTVPEMSASLDAMVTQWLEGDADGLAALLNAQETDPALFYRLLTARNITWAEWIRKRMEQPGTVFMAVGAGHLAGKGSVQDQLRTGGITSTRIR